MPVARPSNPKTEAVYRLVTVKNQVRLISPERNEELRLLVRSLGYDWQGYWQRSINYLAGSVEDRAAELGSHLLAGGFVVELPEAIFHKTVNQDYELECKQWILIGSGEYKNWFRLWWKYSGKDFWNTARNFLSGNRYDPISECVCVPSVHFAEVEDFAQVHGFRFSDKALKLLEQAKKRRAEMLTVDIQIKQSEKPKKQDTSQDDLSDKYLDTPYRDLTIKPRSSLYTHQAEAVEKVLPNSIGALFMEMGTGKTRTAIELVCKRQQRISNIIWFCPVSLKETIYQEIKKHTNTPNGQIVKFDDKTAIANLPDALWYIVGIESMSSSDRVVLTVNHILNRWSFVIVDESSYIKGHRSRRTNRITDLAMKARYRLILTGTPLSQGVVDLYAQMRFLSSDVLGYKSFYSFARNHLEYSEEYPGMIIRSHNTDLLASKIQPFIYQVTKEECLDLPDKLFNSTYFLLTDKQQEAYEQAKNELLLSVDVDEIDSYAIFRLFTALQQIVSGFWNRDGELLEFEHFRLNTLLDTIDSIPDDQKIVIWCKYRYSVQAIAEKLDKVSLFYGDLNETKRNEELEKFRRDNRFFVSTQATGGHGLTLNESHYVIFYENGFKYSERLQAEDRCHRIGQENKVTYIDLVSQSGIDRRIIESLARKGNLVKDFKRKIDKVKDKKRLIKLL